MAIPAFIAETPRAGIWNHCLLLPEDSSISENKARQIIANARQIADVKSDEIAWGEDFAALAMERRQLTDGNRLGVEVLAAVNFQTAHLSPRQRIQTESALRSALPDLEDLVLNRIPWSNFLNNPTLHRCRELDRWAQDWLVVPSVCYAKPPDEPKSAVRLSGIRVIFALALIALVAIALIASR